jgi:hypothetical protein
VPQLASVTGIRFCARHHPSLLLSSVAFRFSSVTAAGEASSLATAPAKIGSSLGPVGAEQIRPPSHGEPLVDRVSQLSERHRVEDGSIGERRFHPDRRKQGRSRLP